MHTRPVVLGLVAVLAAGLSVAACARPSPTPSPAPTPTVTPMPPPSPTPSRAELPADDAPHTGVNTEWWYYSGHLSTEDGAWYGFHYALFQISLPGQPSANIAQVGIVDHGTREYATDQRGAWAVPQARDIPGFTFAIGEWKLSGYDGDDKLAMTMPDYAFDIVLKSRKPAVLHGGTGLVDFGPGAQSFYYSRTNMAIAGKMTVRGKMQDVVGHGWFDHQWGNFTAQELGWDWIALQLDSSEELLLSYLRDKSGKPVHVYGTWVRRDGTYEHLEPARFQAEPTGSWTSPATGATYPMGWRVRFPDGRVDVTVTPVIQDAEFDARATTRNVYWEGDVLISGSHGGRGYVEMVGYAPLALPGR